MARIRPAVDDDMPQIGALHRAADYGDHGVDWTRPGLAPYWLVAERDGALVGALQYVTSQPCGYVLDIVVHPEARGTNADRAAAERGAIADDVTTQLCLAAMFAMRRAGVQCLIGVVGDAQPLWQRVLEAHGGQRLGGRDATYGLYAWRLS
jgi:hypothetical protein